MHGRPGRVSRLSELELKVQILAVCLVCYVSAGIQTLVLMVIQQVFSTIFLVSPSATCFDTIMQASLFSKYQLFFP